MSKGWVRVREAAAVLRVSESTVRRRIAEGQLRGRTGQSGRREVYLPAKLRGSLQRDGLSRRQAADQDSGTASSAQTAVLSPPPTTHTEECVDVDRQAKPAVDDSAHELEDIVKRYERLAGGSLMLAQQRADELTQATNAAYENLAHTRDQLRRLRRVAVAGWVTSAVLLAMVFALSLALAA